MSKRFKPTWKRKRRKKRKIFQLQITYLLCQVWQNQHKYKLATTAAQADIHIQSEWLQKCKRTESCLVYFTATQTSAQQLHMTFNVSLSSNSLQSASCYSLSEVFQIIWCLCVKWNCMSTCQIFEIQLGVYLPENNQYKIFTNCKGMCLKTLTFSLLLCI